MTHKSLPAPSLGNKQVREYVEAARKGLGGFLVARSEKGWVARPVGRKGGPRTFATEDAAVLYARESGGHVIFPDREG